MKLLRDKMDANIVMNAFILAGVLGSALFFTVTLGASRHNQSRYPFRRLSPMAGGEVPVIASLLISRYGS